MPCSCFFVLAHWRAQKGQPDDRPPCSLLLGLYCFVTHSKKVGRAHVNMQRRGRREYWMAHMFCLLKHTTTLPLHIMKVVVKGGIWKNVSVSHDCSFAAHPTLL